MSVQLGITVSGVRETLEGFSALPVGLQKKYLRAAVNKVAKPYVPQVRKLVARGPTGNLKRAVGLVMEAKVKGRTQTGVLGFRRGDAKGTNGLRSGYHAWWIENGVKVRQPKFRQALNVPIEVARQYPYMLGKVALIGGEDGGSIFFRRVKGFSGTGSFGKWSERVLPEIRDKLQEELGRAFVKATNEAARRAAKAAAKAAAGRAN
jgi:hypothetical protein